MTRWFAGLMFGLLLCAHAWAEDAPKGDDAEQARAFFEVGAQAYDRGDYSAAIDAFHEAYARDERPGLLFSMAQAHRRAFFALSEASHLAEAVEYYRRYLASGDAVRRGDAEDALAQLVPLMAPAVDSVSTAVPAAPPEAKLMIASSTPGATLELDGVRAPHLPYVATVSPGMHVLALKAPGFASERREVPMLEGAAFALDIALRELPGELRVAGPPGASLWLDGRPIGALPTQPLSVSAGAYQVSVQLPGYGTATRRVHVGRGARVDVSLALAPTIQRKASMGLLAAGASVGLVGGVLALVAHARQGDAVQLLDARERRTWSEADFDRYETLAARRDALRTGAFTAGGLSAVAILLGAALYALDRPDVPRPTGSERPGAGRPPPTLPGEVIAGPHWDGRRLGVEIRGRF